MKKQYVFIISVDDMISESECVKMSATVPSQQHSVHTDYVKDVFKTYP